MRLLQINIPNSFFDTLKDVSTSPYALIGYVVLIICWGILSYRSHRFKLISENLKKLPEEDRKQILQTDYGYFLKEGMTAEEFIKTRRNALIFYIALSFIAAITIIIIISLLNTQGGGEKIAQLDICPSDYSGQNPVRYINTKKDSIACKILYCNVGNDISTNISDLMIAFTYPNGKIKYDTVGKNSILNESEIIAPNQPGKGMFVKLYSKDHVPLDIFPYTIYMYLKVSYSNSNGNEMRPMKKIFFIQKGELLEVNKSEYEKLKNDLITEKLW